MNVRRVVTGLDEQGRPCIISDGTPPGIFTFPAMKDYAIAEICAVDHVPAQNGDVHLEAREWRLEPPDGGVHLRIVTRPPEDSEHSNVDSLLSDVGATEGRAGLEHRDKAGMHTTKTIDFLVILSGEVYLTVGESEVLLKPGDCVVQGGVQHAWHNRGSEPCVMAGIMISAAGGGLTKHVE